jgi:hypothetical protein
MRVDMLKVAGGFLDIYVKMKVSLFNYRSGQLCGRRVVIIKTAVIKV